MSIRKLTMAVLLSAILVLPASAAPPMTGSQLLDYCTSEEAVERTYCMGYIMGYAEGAGGWGRAWCVPDGVTNGQVMEVVIRQLKTNPRDRHAGASLTVHRALRDAWPCEKLP